MRYTISLTDEEYAASQRRLAAEASRIAGELCSRCNGKGTIRGFSHIEGGSCFACKGSGKRRVCR